jgi:hypothetical protein
MPNCPRVPALAGDEPINEYCATGFHAYCEALKLSWLCVARFILRRYVG